MATRQGTSFSDGARNDWPAALRTEGLGQGTRENRHAGIAERDAAARVQHAGTNPARRGKHERGKGVAHSSQLGPHRSAESHRAKPTLKVPSGKEENHQIGMIRVRQERVPDLEQSLFVLLRAAYAISRPGYRFQTLLLKFFLALYADAVSAVLDAHERFVNQL